MKLLLVGIASIVSTLAGCLAAALMTGLSTDPTHVDPPALEMIRLDVVSVPVIRGGAIQGYVLARAVVGVGVEDAKKIRAPITFFAAEGLFRAIHEEGIDFSALMPANIARLADRATKLTNERVGHEAVRRMAIDSVNFVSQSEVRQSNSPQRHPALQR
jgi:hypothetical protein